jgi:hypothetical protein
MANILNCAGTALPTDQKIKKAAGVKTHAAFNAI